jgi:HD-GYP domain-containing protein (c-di-GMP phosphodiesterase class II)
MIEQPANSASGLDQTLVDILSSKLHCQLSLVDDQEQNPAAVVVKARTTPGKAAIGDDPSGYCIVALHLPAGGVATWLCDPTFAAQSAALGETCLALQSVMNERNQLQAEADALAAQVVDDFEEMSLIRSLASAMELPSRGVDASELALKSLRPLARGVGAHSMVAVFVNEDGEIGLPCWSGSVITTGETMHELIKEHRDAATTQPVVCNHAKYPGRPGTEQSLNEFMLVQCRSEGRLHGWLVACNRIDDGSQDIPWSQLGFTTVEASLLATAANQLAAQLHNMRLLKQKEELFTDVVRALVNAVEARDPYTCGHSERVAQFGRCLAEAIGETAIGCERVYLTGLLHDVGKIAIPDGVLQKPGSLNKEERAIIETHTEAGWRILHELEALRDVLSGVLYHHETYDGNGYPDGLAGEEIPLDGRILAVCDAFDAMTSDRPYRDGMPVEKAVEILREGAGRYWDPKLIEVFLENIEKIKRIRQKHRPRLQAKRSASGDGQANVNSQPLSA